MSDEEEKRRKREENLKRFEEMTRNRRSILGDVMARGMGRHAAQTLYGQQRPPPPPISRPIVPSTTTRPPASHFVPSTPTRPISIPSSRPVSSPRRVTPLTDDSPVFQQFGEPEPTDFSGPSQPPTEPSVRPKIRQVQLRPASTFYTGGQSTSGEQSRPRSQSGPVSPYENVIPTPDIVYRYRDPMTQELDLNRLTKYGKVVTRDPRERYIDLTNESRTQTRNLTDYDRRSYDRQLAHLQTDPRYEPKYIKDELRFVPKQKHRDAFTQTPPWPHTPRRQLLPRTEEDRIRDSDPRFKRYVSNMGHKYQQTVSFISPLGRQQYGPTERRASSLPNLSEIPVEQQLIPQRLRDFGERYSSLDQKEQDIYKDVYRKSIDPRKNLPAYKRLVNRPTQYRINEDSQRRISRDKRDRTGKGWKTTLYGQDDAEWARRKRQQATQQKAMLPPSFNPNVKDPLDTFDRKVGTLLDTYREPISEANEDEEESEESNWQ